MRQARLTSVCTDEQIIRTLRAAEEVLLDHPAPPLGIPIHLASEELLKVMKILLLT